MSISSVTHRPLTVILDQLRLEKRNLADAHEHVELCLKNVEAVQKEYDEATKFWNSQKEQKKLLIKQGLKDGSLVEKLLSNPTAVDIFHGLLKVTTTETKVVTIEVGATYKVTHNLPITAETNLLGVSLDMLFVMSDLTGSYESKSINTIPRGYFMTANNPGCERLTNICYKYRMKDSRFTDNSMMQIAHTFFKTQANHGNTLGGLRIGNVKNIRISRSRANGGSYNANELAKLFEEFYVSLFGKE